MKKRLTLDQCKEAKQFLSKSDASLEYIMYKSVEYQYFKDPGTWVYSDILCVQKGSHPSKSSNRIDGHVPYAGTRMSLAPCWTLGDLFKIIEASDIKYTIKYNSKYYLIDTGDNVIDCDELIDGIYSLIRLKWQNEK